MPSERRVCNCTTEEGQVSTPTKIETALKRYRDDRTDPHYRAVKAAVRSWLEHLQYKTDDDAVAVGVKLLEGTKREVRLDDAEGG